MSKPTIVKVEVTLKRVKQRRNSQLPPEVVFEEITIKVDSGKTKLEYLFDQKDTKFVSNSMVSALGLPNQSDLIEYYKVDKVKVLQKLGEAVYHVDDSYNEVKEEALIELDEEEWDNG